MTLVEVMKKVEPGDIIERYETDSEGKTISLGHEFVVLKNNKLKSVGDEYGTIDVDVLCSDGWRIVENEF